MKMYRAQITVTLRPSILDPEGKAVEHALDSLALPGIKQVRMGKLIEMKLQAESRDTANTIVEDACRKLLANPVMEDYSVTIEELNGK